MHAINLAKRTATLTRTLAAGALIAGAISATPAVADWVPPF